VIEKMVNEMLAGSFMVDTCRPRLGARKVRLRKRSTGQI
jgi:hypothetical protein